MPRKPETFVKNEKPAKASPNKRFDGELYQRPVPNPFSENWRNGFHAGYDATCSVREPGKDLEWRDGYQTGVDQVVFDMEERDRVGSSNA